MSYLKNSFILVLILLLTILLLGCQKKEYTTNVIEEKDIMMQEEKEYYVYFFKDDCPYCDDVYDIINDYLNNPTELKLYVCQLTEESEIKRQAEGGNGQGPDGKYYVDWVIDYKNLCIAGVPSLIRVRSNSVHYECFYVTSGRKNIIEYFTNLNNLKVEE